MSKATHAKTDFSKLSVLSWQLLWRTSIKYLVISPLSTWIFLSIFSRESDPVSNYIILTHSCIQWVWARRISTTTNFQITFILALSPFYSLNIEIPVIFVATLRIVYKKCLLHLVVWVSHYHNLHTKKSLQMPVLLNVKKPL